MWLFLLGLGLLAWSGTETGTQGDRLSTGVYRLPYEDNTQVSILNDHVSHRPTNRLDMAGLTKQRIVAAADGIVRFIVDQFETRQGASAHPCYNNYVWIEHSNGEWTKYSHMEKASSRGRANLRVGDALRAGAYLGDEGDVGCATQRHLHFEVAVPRDPADPINPMGGFIKGENRTPRFCDVPGQMALRGNQYRAAPCRP
jgi:murein DD-endopeptidase MepM/ murein hydrolase activator NlpD